MVVIGLVWQPVSVIIGIGMYQKDVSVSQLQAAAHDVVQDCIHLARVDLNARLYC